MSANTVERNFPILHLAEGPGNDDPAGGRKRMLKQLADRLDQHHAFAKGQFVVWKAGLTNRKFPDYGEPCIAANIPPAPFFDPSEVSAASPYFQEPLGLVIGVLHEDDFIEYRVDGRRFEPSEG
jgi:hypothetical protein